MSKHTIDLDASDPLYSDDSNTFNFFPSSPSSHRFTSPAPPDITPTVSNQRTLPLELIGYIVEIFHRQYCSFRAIRALSEASSQLRVIALQQYMASLNIHSAKQLVSLFKMHRSMISQTDTAVQFKGLYWVKNLTAQAGDLAKAPWKPSLLSSLRTLSVSFAKDVRSTQMTRSKRIFGVPLMGSPMSHLVSLTLTELWRIDVSLLSIVSGTFPGLTSLHLSCSEHLDTSCCWTCFEDSSSAVVHSPIPNHFPTVASLTSSFAKALKPLIKLTDLHLGIFLSDEEMLENHIDHYESPRVYSRARGTTTFVQNRDPAYTVTSLSQPDASGTTPGHISYTKDEKNLEGAETFNEVPPFPHGPELCPICSIVVSASDVRARELEASLALAQKLKSLRTIGWSSFFAWKPPFDDGEKKKIGDWRRIAKTYVLRSGGRVRVRRQPWD